jgi:dienelactone hydrolase
MLRSTLVALAILLSTLTANAQLFGNGQQLNSLKEFSDGKFQFESVKSVYWPQIANEGRNLLSRAEKTWVPARLYMPATGSSKVPAMVIVHGIGGLYTKDGRKRAYWDYAELLAANGIAALVIDTHGARGVGVSSMLGSTEVSVYTFVADAFAGADMLRSHSRIDPERIGIMGFSKGGMTTLLATDKRFADTFSATSSPFALHMPIYPGCQNYPDRLQATRAPVHMLLGERDNFTGTSGCFEIADKLKASGTPVRITLYKGAFHSWDEDFRPVRIDDVSSEDCRWVLKDDGGVWGGGTRPLNTAAEGQAYFRGCTKSAEIFAGRVEPANTEGRQAVVDTVKATLGPN